MHNYKGDVRKYFKPKVLAAFSERSKAYERNIGDYQRLKGIYDRLSADEALRAEPEIKEKLSDLQLKMNLLFGASLRELDLTALCRIEGSSMSFLLPLRHRGESSFEGLESVLFNHYAKSFEPAGSVVNGFSYSEHQGYARMHATITDPARIGTVFANAISSPRELDRMGVRLHLRLSQSPAYADARYDQTVAEEGPGVQYNFAAIDRMLADGRTGELQRSVLALVKKQGVITQADVVEKLRRNKTHAYQILRKLEKKGLLVRRRDGTYHAPVIQAEPAGEPLSGGFPATPIENAYAVFVTIDGKEYHRVADIPGWFEQPGVQAPIGIKDRINDVLSRHVDDTKIVRAIPTREEYNKYIAQRRRPAVTR